MTTLLNPAGGLYYHYRALRHGKSLWQPFRWALGEWLLGWQPPEPTLILFGPSAGYCLQPFLFERFERVICLEPDPLARLGFARRLARAPLERRPVLEMIADDHLVHHPERLAELLERWKDAALLFSNVIGQLCVLLGVEDPEAPELARVREAVRAACRGRSWASFHDRVSGAPEPAIAQPLWCDGRLEESELLELAYGEVPEGARGPGDNELLDHMTGGFFPSELPHVYFVWQLLPGAFHLIEGVRGSGLP